MRYIDKILNGREVVWRPLGEVFETRNGYTPSKSNPDFWDGGTIPWFRMEDIRLNGRILSDAIQHITPLGVKGKGLFKSNSIIMATTATIGEHALLIADSLANQRFTNFEIRESLSCKLLPKFAFYYFYIIDEWCKQNVDVSSFPSVQINKLKQVPFPIPPRDVQEEIVGILDKFTELERELEISLERELELRLKQYEYYRNKLLTFDDDKVQWRPLGEVGRVRMCKRILKDQTSDVGDIPFYKIGTFGGDADSFISKELFQEYKQKFPYPKKGDILISASGTIGKCVIYKGEEAYYQDSNIVWIDNNESIVLNKYLYYCYQIVKWKISVGGTIKRLYNDNLLKTIIPIPYYNDRKKSMDEQERIVEILDKFDKLVNSISEGLPREIELRRKQYEYYRNELLTFN